MKRLALLIIFAVLSIACSRQPTSTSDLPPLLHPAHRVSVAPFMQPVDPSQVILGQIPVAQGEIPASELETLDEAFRNALLKDTSRTYNFLEPRVLEQVFNNVRSTGQPQGFSAWLAYGNAHNLDYLLVPQILDWHERAGSEAGVTESAHVRAEFFLINIPASTVAGRSVYEVKQVGLVENLLTVAEFVKRRGRWVTATQLAIEGMEKAIKELGL